MYHQARKHPQVLCTLAICNSQCAFTEWHYAGMKTSVWIQIVSLPGAVSLICCLIHLSALQQLRPLSSCLLDWVQSPGRKLSMPREWLEGCCTSECVVKQEYLFCFENTFLSLYMEQHISDIINYSVMILLKPLDLSWPFSWILYFLHV